MADRSAIEWTDEDHDGLAYQCQNWPSRIIRPALTAGAGPNCDALDPAARLLDGQDHNDMPGVG